MRSSADHLQSAFQHVRPLLYILLLTPQTADTAEPYLLDDWCQGGEVHVDVENEREQVRLDLRVAFERERAQSSGQEGAPH